MYTHKEQLRVYLQPRFPSLHFNMVDDKPGILTATKAKRGDRLPPYSCGKGIACSIHITLPQLSGLSGP